MNSATFSKLVIIAITLLLLPASQALAATITTSATCTLEQAWAAARDNSAGEGCAAVGAFGDDTIILHANAVIAGSDLTLTNGSTITVEGRGHTIDANRNDQHFATAEGATINLNNVKLTGGRNGQPSSITVADSGDPSAINITNSVICGNESTSTSTIATGAIRVSASQTLVIRNSVICDNTGGALGGAIKNVGNATIINSVFYGNTASADGGAINVQGATQGTGGGRTILRHVTITNNTAPHGSGIFLRFGPLEIRNSIIYGNKSGPDCRSHSQYSGTVTVSGFILGTSVDCGNHFTPSSTADPLLVDRTSAATPHYALGAGSPAISAAPCLTGNDAVPRDLLGRSRPTSGNCDLGAVVYVPPPQQPTTNGSGSGSGNGNGGGGGGGGNGGGGGGRGGDSAMAPTPVRLSPPDTCAALSPAIQVSNASPGAACNRVDGSSIGHPDVAASGFMDAVDLWGWVTPDTKVCFRASSGSIRFIDTTVSPRTVSDLPVFSEAGLICGMIDRAGQVALVPGPPVASDAAPEPAAQVIGKSLSDCMVRTKYNLNFRDAPAGNRIGGVRYNAVLTALARTPGWFKVDLHGLKGWIAAMYVEPMGLCG